MNMDNFGPSLLSWGNWWQYARDYWRDASQRQILFWDTLRQRGDIYLEHREQGNPPVLDFGYDVIMDGRDLEQPCNYSLLRIIAPDDVQQKPGARPFVIIDPRAGHGPGIGGSKFDSQVGVALRAGHPVYFVTFSPRPVPGQRLDDVAGAEALFIEEVARRHPEAVGKPCVVGNCQAGWAVAALAALRPELVGPIMLNGAPLSYWSGVDGKNPMRYAGGLLGGKWLASLASDLGNGLFDGAHLVANFENLNPANTLWTKQYNLYSKIDTEAPRYLDFEKWWGGFFLMNAEEIDDIVSHLFIGNRLARGRIVIEDGRTIDLKNIRSPIIVFASFGDNITPPQQALNWIADVYGHEDHIVANDDVIVYLLNDHIGHLGIFVSGSVARKETTELVDTLEMIDRLPPGLYEMVIEKHDDGAGHAVEPGAFAVHFETRTIQNILDLDDGRREETYFEAVEATSAINERMYRTLARPYIRALASDTSAEWLRNTHPHRLQRTVVSSLNPWLAFLPHLADTVRAQRRACTPDNPWLIAEQAASDMIIAALDACRDIRDDCNRAAFKWIYGASPWAVMLPPAPPESSPEALDGVPRSTALEHKFECGTPLEGAVRIIIAVALRTGRIERRAMRIARHLRMNSRFRDLSDAEMKRIVRDQAAVLRLDENRALEGLAMLLPTANEREGAADFVRQVFEAEPEDIGPQNALVSTLENILDIDLRVPQSA